MALHVLTFYGYLPFNNSDPTNPNEAYFELVDWTVDLAASYEVEAAYAEGPDRDFPSLLALIEDMSSV
ncbi:hypothetical protein PF011_g11902 [Phytophthora fragariae]|nr:hypothetical protein PF011_g11902 [Phytophthora fragariae]